MMNTKTLILELNSLIHVLEYSVAKKPDRYENDSNIYCPTCGRPTLNTENYQNHCFVCGQKIDWSEIDDIN